MRAELDGLPIEERTGAPFASTNGAMHACGHDVHAAALVALVRAAGQRNGAVGENRTHDLSLTKGLRYHYATTATVVFRTCISGGTLTDQRGSGRGSLKGALL